MKTRSLAALAASLFLGFLAGIGFYAAKAKKAEQLKANNDVDVNA